MLDLLFLYLKLYLNFAQHPTKNFGPDISLLKLVNGFLFLISTISLENYLVSKTPESAFLPRDAGLDPFPLQKPTVL